MIDDSGIDFDELMMKDENLPYLKISINPQTYEIITKLYDLFQNYDKVDLWLYTKNPMLGYITPIKLIYVGRGHKVLQMIDNAKEGNIA